LAFEATLETISRVPFDFELAPRLRFDVAALPFVEEARRFCELPEPLERAPLRVVLLEVLRS
jgi:hypothetical protein